MPNTERRPLSSTYLLTFTCYGARLHGSELGSVDRAHSVYGTPYADENNERLTAVKERMVDEPYRLNASRRNLVLSAILEGCERRGWELLASHVRSNHVHAVVTAQVALEKVLSALKSYASKALNEAGYDQPSTRRWTRHGSTRYLWKDSEVESAIGYVVRDQGKPMAVYEKQGRGRWAKPSQ
ncbi:MAG: transposase [Acidobacteria bacterium]|nr:transposase [Acidobacteriota bacterium]